MGIMREFEVKRGLKFICSILTRNDFQAVGFSSRGSFPLYSDTMKMVFETDKAKI